ncbi:MAG TPA: cytochrome P450 [Puia sp.]|nr:cytochrome P450 [Puia sp.]
MNTENKTYHLPAGYSAFQSILRSYRFLSNPIKFVSLNMAKFSGTYSVATLRKYHLILTQDPAFINYVLKENHSNYHKSSLTAERAAKYFGKGFLFSNGEDWLTHRRLVQPGFHREKIQGLYGIMIDSIEKSLSTFPTGASIDIYPLVHQLAFNIVISSLFTIHLSSDTMTELSRTFSEVQDFYIKEINQPVRRLFYPFNHADKRNLQKSARMRAILKGIIEERRASKDAFSDLLDILLHTRYEDSGLPIPEEQLIDQILVLIFAGHETVANTLSWLLYALASEPEVVKKLRASMEARSIQDSVKDEYIAAVINEGMRLYPAAWMTDRVALKDDRFGEYSFPSGTIILSFFYGLHRDKEYWDDESAFHPERFLTENAKEKKPKNFFPFGAGPRLCIGNNFAMAEMSFFLYAFFTKFQISPTGQIPELKPLITLRPDKVILDVRQYGG